MHSSRLFPNMIRNTRWMDGFLQVAMALALLNFAAKNASQPAPIQNGLPLFGQQVEFPSRYDEKPSNGAEQMFDQLLSMNGPLDRREIRPNHAMYTMPTSFAGPMPFHRQSSCDSDELSLLSAADSSGPTNSFYRRDGSSPFNSESSPFSSTSSSGNHELAGSDDLPAYSPRFTLNDFDFDLLDTTRADSGELKSDDDDAKKQALPDLSGLEMQLSRLQGGMPDHPFELDPSSHTGFDDFSGLEFNFPTQDSTSSSPENFLGSDSDDMVYFDPSGLPIFAGQDQITDDDINELLASTFPEDSKAAFQDLSASLPHEKPTPQTHSDKLVPPPCDVKLPWDADQKGANLIDSIDGTGKTGKYLHRLSETEVTEMPVEKFNAWVKSLDSTEVEIAKDLRRKGKNKMAARNCRKRKFDAIGELENEIAAMKRKQAEIVGERERLLRETEDARKSTQWLHEVIFDNLRDDKGQRFSKEDFTLQYSSDGSVYLVPRHLTVKAGLTKLESAEQTSQNNNNGSKQK